MKKCEYCAKEISYFEQYCSDECQTKANRFYEISEKYNKLFAVINIICLFGIPVGIFFFSFSKEIGTVLASVCCAILGIMLILLPFPAESMISKYKIQKAQKITRIIGLCLIGLGIAIVGFYFFFLI